MDEKIKEARQAGYSDSEIAAYLTQQGQDISNLGLNLPQQNAQTNYAPQQTSPDYQAAQPTAPTASGANWEDFVKKAQVIARLENFPVSVLLAQAALESGRGQSGLTTQYNNYFGIKGKGGAGAANMPTQEADANGNYYTVNSDFRAYKTPEQSIQDYIDLIKKEYPNAYAQKDDPYKMLQAIKAGGYATSPTYVQNVASTPEFQQYYGLDRKKK